MWIKTKEGNYANMAFLSLLWRRNNEWVISENASDGYCQPIEDETAQRLIDETAQRLIDRITKELL